MATLAVSSNHSSSLTWSDALRDEKKDPYFQSIISTIDRERKSGKVIYPPNHEVFNALSLTPLESVKVVILGQDPYHGPGQAHGLCFSVRNGVPAPPSLQNIFKELEQDLQIPRPSHGCLEHWATQGVLLLNASLTVERGKPQSHQHLGWHRFTDTVVQLLNEQCDHLVFMLWGASAQKKGSRIDSSKHLVLKAPHPSPLSAHRGFFGCKHFSTANEYLRQHKDAEIDWSLPS